MKTTLQNPESFAYDWIKSLQLQTSCSMRVRILACLESGLMDFTVSSCCAKSNASCMASSKVKTLSSRSYCSRSVWHSNKHSISVSLPTITQTDVPRGWQKPSHMPLLQAGGAECESRLSRGDAKHHTHFCNWVQHIHHLLDPPDGTFPCIKSTNQLHDFVSAMESNQRILSKRRLCLTVWHSRAGRAGGGRVGCGGGLFCVVLSGGGGGGVCGARLERPCWLPQ